VKQTMTINDVAENQNDAAAVEIELETVVEKAIDEFNSITSITIDHIATYERPGRLHVTIYTGEAESFEDYLQLFSTDHKIAIDRGDETLLVPFTVVATFDGPVTSDSLERTTIYMDENVLGARPVELEDGLAYVRDKLQKPEQWEWERGRGTQLDRIRNYTD